jgi:hypothetical protein
MEAETPPGPAIVSRARTRPLTWSHRTVPLTRVSDVQHTPVSRIPMRLPSPGEPEGAAAQATLSSRATA